MGQKSDNFQQGLADWRGGASLATNLALSYNDSQLRELLAKARAAGVALNLPAHSAPTFDTFVLAPAASQTNTITIKATVEGPAAAIATVQIGDAAGDTLAVTVTAGAILISLANTTDSKNTLTLIKAALDAALTSTTGAIYSTFITGTASTQMVHGGTNTVAATAAGGTASGGLKSSTAGVASSRTLAVATVAA